MHVIVHDIICVYNFASIIYRVQRYAVSYTFYRECITHSFCAVSVYSKVQIPKKVHNIMNKIDHLNISYNYIY